MQETYFADRAWKSFAVGTLLGFTLAFHRLSCRQWAWH